MGFFIIRLSNPSDCDKTINGGPYFSNSKLIILKKWSNKVKMDKDLLSTEHIWIRLPNLAFSVIASILGMPLKLDEPTAKEIRLNYARILVEISTDANLPEEAVISMYNGEIITQKIEYEWISPVVNLVNVLDSILKIVKSRRFKKQSKIMMQEYTIQLMKSMASV